MPPKKTTKRKATAATSLPDFKRRKAKVGKKAPEKLNATDTAFKSASLHVRDQSIENDKEATSSGGGGKPLSNLLSLLSHHAATARCAAIKNIRETISKDADGVVGNLSSLIPSLSKCGVDEDYQVREAALVTLRGIFHCSAITNLDSFKPFIPLHVAYLASAMNSLDGAIRKDAVRAVETVATRFPSMLRVHVHGLLPAYARVLNDCRSSSGDAGAAQRRGARRSRRNVANKKGAAAAASTPPIHNQPRYLVLKSLFSLLQTNSPTEIQEEKAFPGSSTCAQLSHRTTTAIVFCRSLTLQSNPMDTHEPSLKKDVLSNHGLQQLLLQLRDAWIELVQASHDSDDVTGVKLSSSHMEEISLIVACLHALWVQYSVPLILATDTKFCKQVQPIPGLLLQSFPIQLPDDDRSHASNKHRCDATNTQLCSFFCDTILQNPSSSSESIPLLLDYIQSQLPSFSAGTATVLEQNEIYYKSLTHVLHQLLLPTAKSTKNKKVYLLSEDQRFLLLQTMDSTFFTSQKPQQAKKQPLLLIKVILPLISQSIKNLGHDIFHPTNPVSIQMRKMVSVFPTLLRSFLETSSESTTTEECCRILLTALLDLVRKWDIARYPLCSDKKMPEGDNAQQEIYTWMNEWNTQIRSLFLSEESSQEDDIYQRFHISIQMDFPEVVREKAAGLIGMSSI